MMPSTCIVCRKQLFATSTASSGLESCWDNQNLLLRCDAADVWPFLKGIELTTRKCNKHQDFFDKHQITNCTRARGVTDVFRITFTPCDTANRPENNGHCPTYNRLTSWPRTPRAQVANDPFFC